jgi:hypothetical protein
VTVTGALLAALLACALLLLAFATVIVVKRLLRRRAERRDVALTAPLRPALFSLLGADLLDEEATEALEVLAAIDRASWRALEPTVVSLLTKVRGDAAEALTGLLARPGHRRSATPPSSSREPRHAAPVGTAAPRPEAPAARARGPASSPGGCGCGCRALAVRPGRARASPPPRAGSPRCSPR